MARKKLIRIEEAMALPNIIHHEVPEAKESVAEFLVGAKKTFLELGCGRGEYTVGLSELFPKAHCLGVDIQGERIWHGAKHAIETNNDHILFLRGHIGKINEYVPAHSIDEIWIPFPDPFPRKRQAKKRLTSPRFLKMYQEILKPKGVVNLKTDNENLYLYSKETVQTLGLKILETCEDVYGSTSSLRGASVQAPQDKKEVIESPLFIQTNFEKKFLKQGKKIFYLRFLLA